MSCMACLRVTDVEMNALGPDSLKSGSGRKPRGARDAVSAAAAQVGAGARMKLVVNQVSACPADMHEPHLAESSDWSWS